MPKKVTDSERAARLQPYFNYWMEALCLTGNWHVGYEFKDKITDSHSSFARIYSIPPYQKGFIVFDRPVVDAAYEQELEATVVHELFHLVLNPIQRKVQEYFGDDCFIATELHDVEESVCDKMAEALMAFRYGSTSAYHDSITLESVLPKKEKLA